MINLVDEFVVLDDVQYTRRDWRNRNRIKTPQGVAWITVPVKAKGRYLQRIDETLVSDPSWAQRHWRTLQMSYAHTAHYGTVSEQLRDLFVGRSDEHLSAINSRFTRRICDLLGIRTRITSSADYGSEGVASDRILELCRRVGATRYVSGPAAAAYLDVDAFNAAGVEVSYLDYGGYSEYPQPFPPFVHAVSIVDLLFSTGLQDAPRYMKSFDRDNNCLRAA
jgi:hypothetical protein